MILHIFLDLSQSFSTLAAHRITYGAFNKDINARILPSDSNLIGLDWATTNIGIF